MSINRTQIDVLKFIIEEREISILEIIKKFSLSDRNIRYILKNLNGYLMEFSLPSIKIKNSVVSINYQLGLYDIFLENLNEKNYKLSQEERENYILVNYLFKDNVSLSMLENELNISRTTIKKDIFNLNSQLQKMELSLQYNGYFLEVTGKEKKLRHLKLQKLLDYIKIKNTRIILKNSKYFISKKLQHIIKNYINNYYKNDYIDIINSVEKQLNTVFSEKFKEIMILYFLPTIERIKKNKIIVRKNNSNYLKKLKEYEIIKYCVNTKIKLDFEYEILHLTEYFLSGYYSENHSENIIIVENFVDKLLENLKLQSEILKNQLIKYLIPAIYRIKNNLHLSSEKIKTIDKKDKNYKITVKKIEEIGKIFEIKLQEKLREEEIDNIYYLLMNFDNKKIPIDELLDIVTKYSNFLDKECLKNELLEKYSEFFI